MLTIGLATSGCVPIVGPPPPPPLTFCASTPPSTPEGYAAAFAGIRTSDREWVLADNAYHVELPDRRVVWIFADTHLGKVEGDAFQVTGRGFIHNSFVVQDQACFTPVMGGTRRARTSLIPDPAPNEVNWPFTGAYDSSRNVLHVFSLRIRDEPSLPPPFSFSFAGFDVATFSLPDLTLIEARPIAHLSAAVGGTGQYLPGWNTGGLAVDGYFYGYGRDGTTPQGHVGSDQHFLARAPLATVATSPWEYFAGLVTGGTGPDQPTWSTNPADALPMPFVADPSAPAGATRPGTALQVVPHEGGYLAVGKLGDLVSDDISTWRAPTLAGPWTYTGRAATVPALSYCARIFFTTAGTPIAQWCPFVFDDQHIGASALQFTTPSPASLAVDG